MSELLAIREALQAVPDLASNIATTGPDQEDVRRDAIDLCAELRKAERLLTRAAARRGDFKRVGPHQRQVRAG